MSTSTTFALDNFLGKMLANAPNGKVPETLAEIFIKEEIALKELDSKNRNRKEKNRKEKARNGKHDIKAGNGEASNGEAGNGNDDGKTKEDYVPVVHVAKVSVLC